MSTGECSNPECLYLHINPEDKIRECPYYMRGFCRSGPKCRFKHVKKTTVCENYLIGFCPLGPNCKFGQYISTIIITITRHFLMSKNISLLFVIKTSLFFFLHVSPKWDLPKDDSQAKQTSSSRTSVVCHKCNQTGHKAVQCPKFPQQIKSIPSSNNERTEDGKRPLETVTCYKCGLLGHYANKVLTCLLRFC